MIDFTCGDVVTELPGYPENTFDGCLCDPPYGLGFMGKAWDRSVPPKEVWAEALRVLKPGAMLMAFGGTRTWHRLACAIEDAGFELRDTMMWLYGSGFTKSLGVSKAIDKAAGADRTKLGPSPFASRASNSRTQYGGWTGDDVRVVTAPATPAAKLWSGYGTALKPAWEPILLAMKPCEGTFVENALKWGVAGLAIDVSRIEGYNPSVSRRETARRTGTTPGHPGEYSHTIKDRRTPEAYCADHAGESLGRWPANLLLDEESAAMLDSQSGYTKSGVQKTPLGTGGLFSGVSNNPCGPQYGDSGGASRFFYCAKASRKERGKGNKHPTVKPLSLCTYLARLILPPPRDLPRCILVPFAGSGSEAMGCEAAGWDLVVGIEKEPAYVEIARGRENHPHAAAR